MKKLVVILLMLFVISGCDKIDREKDVSIYTTLYPIEYITNYLYKDYAVVTNIYPSGSDYYTYELSDKQKDIYSNGDIFIYSGATNEAKLAVDFLNRNSNLTIIDATKGVNYTSGEAELWLDPSNYLMIARNIKQTLIDSVDNIYTQNNISNKYDELKIKISEIDVSLTMMGQNASRNNIIVTNDSLLFLDKYNINVVSLDKDNENLTRNYSEARRLISNNDVSYIFILNNDKLDEDLENFITSNNLEKINIDDMFTLSDEQKKNGEDYLSIMANNIDKFKTELFR